MSLAPWKEEHETFRKTVREFAKNELAPYARQWDEAGIFPKELFKRFAEMGFFGIHYPEDVGGLGLDWWYTACYIEELAYSRCAGVNMAMLVQGEMATPVINEIGTREQKEEFLIPALKGEKIAALGVSEPDHGSNVAGLRTTAKRVGDEYVINGAKTFITNGTRADFITLMVRTGEEGYGGISIILFPTDTKGFTVSKSLRKLGHKSSDTGLLYFENCRVPKRYVLGEENAGFYYLMQNFQGERLVAALGACSAMNLMWKEGVRYASEREAFGKKVLKQQVWQHRFADLLTQIRAAQMLTYEALDKMNKKEPCVTDISMAKLFAGELAQKVAYDVLQAHGGNGYMEEYDISRAYRDVRLITIGGGTSEIMREIIAKAELPLS